MSKKKKNPNVCVYAVEIKKKQEPQRKPKKLKEMKKKSCQ